MEDRYLRQRIYENIGKKQSLIEKSKVIIIGLGALGSVCSDLLARAGIKELHLFDYQKVELINLQRQFYDEKDVGKYKVYAAKKRLKKINSDVNIIAYNKRINTKNLDLLKKIDSDIVLVCTDDMTTRFLINKFCLMEKKILITGLVAGSKGYLFKTKGKPCFECVFKKESCFNCQTQGILNSNSVLMASLMTNEVIKTIVDKKSKKKSEDYLFLEYDIWKNEFSKIKIKRYCGLHK